MSIQKQRDQETVTSCQTNYTGNASAQVALDKVKQAINSLTEEQKRELTPKEKILFVADAIENETLAKERRIGFNMATWFSPRKEVRTDHMSAHSCGSVACIAGWTSILFDNYIVRQ